MVNRVDEAERGAAAARTETVTPGTGVDGSTELIELDPLKPRVVLYWPITASAGRVAVIPISTQLQRDAFNPHVGRAPLI